MSQLPNRWSPDAAHAYYNALPYLIGANFIPSNAVNQLEMWQPETFDPAAIDRELGWAAALGMNAMRVFLHDLLWQQDAPAFIRRIESYLDIAHRHNIRTLFVLFDDCWNDNPALGPQPAPKPFTHNSGWLQSPGKSVVNNPALWSPLEKYVTELLTHFRADPRIIGWDLYNEPGNGTAGDNSAASEKQGKKSLPLLTAAYVWARSVPNLSQPLTTAPWLFDEYLAELNEFHLNNADILSFHNYLPPQGLLDVIQKLELHNRPVLCTEYMCRGLGSTFEYCLPLLARHNVGAFHWGLVAGKTNTIYPWNWSAEKGVPDLYFHDVFRADGTLLYPREKQVFLDTAAEKGVPPCPAPGKKNPATR